MAPTKKTSRVVGSNDKVAILPYNKRSASYRALTKALDLKFPTMVDLENASINGVRFQTLINWGSGNIPGYVREMAKTVVNVPTAVNICRNKVKFFEAVAKAGVRIPEFTLDLDTALKWVQDGRTVMGRQATGSCGTDIVFYEDNPGDFQNSQFWVQYKKKKHEFRVHIFEGEVISLQQKAIRTNDEQGQPIPSGTIDFRIRNHRNGFIFKRNDITVPDDVIAQSILAVKSIEGLTFGAVDVIYNQYEDKAYVLEVNTAPGLEGTTLEDYTKAFKSL